MAEASESTIDRVVSILESLGTPRLGGQEIGGADASRLLRMAIVNTDSPDNPFGAYGRSLARLLRAVLGANGGCE